MPQTYEFNNEDNNSFYIPEEWVGKRVQIQYNVSLVTREGAGFMGDEGILVSIYSNSIRLRSSDKEFVVPTRMLVRISVDATVMLA